MASTPDPGRSTSSGGDSAESGAIHPAPAGLDWLVWAVRWAWLTGAALLAGAAGWLPQLLVVAAALGQIGLTLAILRAGSQPGARRLGLVIDVAGPPMVVAALGSPMGATWALLLAPAASLSAYAGRWAGLAAVGGGLLFAGLEWVVLGASGVWALLVSGAHALVLLPAAWLMSSAAQTHLYQQADRGPAAPSARRAQSTLEPDELLFESADLISASLERGLHVLAATGLATEEMAGLALAYQAGRLEEVGRSQLPEAAAHVELELTPDQLEPLLDRRQAASWQELVASRWVQRLMQDMAWQSIACLPLWDQDRCLGLVVFGSRQPRVLAEPQQTALNVLGQEASLALRYAALRQQLVNERDRLSDIQEEARRKLARDLHDGPTQVIAAIAMRTNFARRQVNRDPAMAIAELEKVEAMARLTTKEIRHMLFTLRPLILESQGLTAALRQYADKIAETHDQPIALDLDRAVDQGLSRERQGVLFYIAEEAVTNALKHAAAERIELKLWMDGPEVVLEVNDDGVGFHMGQVDANYEQRGSLGMVTMRERAQLLQAALEIQSEEAVGTTIRVRLPADPAPADQPVEPGSAFRSS